MTRNLRAQLADMGEQFIRLARGHVTRERAADLMSDWALREPLDDELRAEILSRFPLAEAAAVAGLDFLPGVEADAALSVAGLDAEDLRIEKADFGAFAAAVRVREYHRTGYHGECNKDLCTAHGDVPLVEVTDEPTAVA